MRPHIPFFLLALLTTPSCAIVRAIFGGNASSSEARAEELPRFSAKSDFDFSSVHTIGFLPTRFAGEQGVPESVGEQVRDLFVQEFQSRGYSLITQDRIEAVLDEQGRQHGGLTDAAHSVRLGKLLNAQVLVFSNFLVNKADASLTYSVVETETGEILWMGNGYRKFSDSMILEIRQLASQMCRGIPNRKP